MNLMARDRDELKTSFSAREGAYKLVSLPDYVRPTRGLYTTNGQGNTPVRVSFITPTSKEKSEKNKNGHGNDDAVSFQDDKSINSTDENADSDKKHQEYERKYGHIDSAGGIKDDHLYGPNDYLVDKMCLNYGKEMYVYPYCGLEKVHSSETKPIDKRVYKGTFPTCHDFNETTARPDSILLLIGFTAGQVQLVDPIQKERTTSRLYNEERLIDKTRVTCLKWVPSSPNQFLVSHASGQMYLYNEELLCGATAPHYQPFKSGHGFSIHTCKTRSTRNPLYRWVIGQNENNPVAINQFAFSPVQDGRLLAIVSQDGYLRVVDYHSMDLQGSMRSYFGGLLCVAWSPDGRFVAVGGEDDLVTVWSVKDRQVVCRGEGHRSWVNVVRFDPYLSNCPTPATTQTSSSSDSNSSSSSQRQKQVSVSSSTGAPGVSAEPAEESRSYRLGSVGQDTMLCLWELSDDIVKQALRNSRLSSSAGSAATLQAVGGTSTTEPHYPSTSVSGAASLGRAAASGKSEVTSLSQRLAAFTLPSSSSSKDTEKEEKHKKEHRRNFSLPGGKNNHVKPATGRNSAGGVDAAAVDMVGLAGDDLDGLLDLGTQVCPRIHDVPCLEPLVCKRVANERITELVFRPDHLVIACQEGYLYTWARPPPPAAPAPAPTSSSTSASAAVCRAAAASPPTNSTAQPNTDGTVV